MSWASATVSDRTADAAPRAGSFGGRIPDWPAIALGATMSSHAHAFVHRAVVQSLQRVEAALLVGGEARLFFSSRRRHTRFDCDWSSDVCSSDLAPPAAEEGTLARL